MSELALSNPSEEKAPSPKLPEDWLKVLGNEFSKPYMLKLKEFLKQEKADGKVIYPKGSEIFNALDNTPFKEVKVVILGQDPYHGPNQAHGLSFSVRKGVPKPPSLVNIYKEIERDLQVKMPPHGDLTSWAKQGVLLLNAMLTVQQANAGSHQKKGAFIDRTKHLVLESVHPSPLSAHRGFLGNEHFSKANDYLKQQGLQPIQWEKLDD